MTRCAACGTSKNIYTTLGGVPLCRDHYQDILDQVTTIRATGQQVNVAGLARQMYRAANDTHNYILRDIPKDIWDRIQAHANANNISLREAIIDALDNYTPPAR